MLVAPKEIYQVIIDYKQSYEINAVHIKYVRIRIRKTFIRVTFELVLQE